MVNRGLLCAALLFVSGASLRAQTENVDIKGWNGLTWGMSLDSVHKQLGASIVPPNSSGLLRAITAISGQMFSVELEFREDELFEVVLKAQRDSAKQAGQFTVTLAELLSAKYGRPNSGNGGMLSPDFGTGLYQWHRSSGNIILLWSAKDVSISYRRVSEPI